MNQELRLSASLYKRFKLCPKQAALSLDRDLKYLSKTSPAAALGRVAHKIVETCSKNPPGWGEIELRTWFESKWEELIHSEYELIKEEWKPNHVLEPESWRGLFKTKAAAKTLVTKSSGLLPHRGHGVSDANHQAAKVKLLTLPLVEEMLFSEEIGIQGQPDFVFLENGKATIYDYKFGKDQLDLEAHREQLYFYVILIEALLKIEVGRCAVVASANKIWDVPIDRNYMEHLRVDLLRVAKAIRDNNGIAIPKVENCGYCPFKSECTSFQSAKLKTADGYPMAIRGSIARVHHVDEGSQEIFIVSEDAPNDVEIRVFGIPNGYPLEVGHLIQVTDNLYFHSPSMVEFGWNSRLVVAN